MSKDLVVLVPDKCIEQALRGLLARPEDLAIRPIEVPEFVVHPNRDPGVYHTGHELIAPYAGECRHALICFDLAWQGAPSSVPAELEAHVESNCRVRWNDQVRCVVIDPEIEAWLWADSPHIATALGWPGSRELRAWLRGQNLWSGETKKPSDPKAAFRAAMRHKRLPPSASVFGQLARQVNFRHCEDGAFQRLVRILQTWFRP